jgi:hypothetical protein
MACGLRRRRAAACGADALASRFAQRRRERIVYGSAVFYDYVNCSTLPTARIGGRRRREEGRACRWRVSYVVGVRQPAEPARLPRALHSGGARQEIVYRIRDGRARLFVYILCGPDCFG